MIIEDYRPEPPKAKEFIPHCPVCGAECDTLYEDMFGEFAGCERCIHLKDAYEELYQS